MNRIALLQSWRRLSVSLFALCAFTSPVLADEADEADSAAAASGFFIEEITVTSRKREENLQDTPISVAAFTENDLRVRQIEASDKLTQVTPNLQYSSQAPSSGSNASSQIFIRGIGQTEFLPSTDPGVGLYIDGVYMARTVGGTLDFLDLDRIEILRGPQGTLFGRNTIGGAISIHSKRPANEFGGDVEVTLGKDNRREFRGNVDVPITDNFRTKLSFSKRDRDGYVTRLSDGLDLGDDDTLGFRVSAVWEPTDNFDVFMAFDYNKEAENGAPQVFNSIASGNLFARVSSARAGCPAPGTELDDPRCANNRWQAGPFATNSTFPLISTLEGWGLNLTLNWDLGFMNVKSITAYRDMEWLASRDADNTPFAILHTRNDDTQEQFSQELQFSGDALDSKLHWLVGLYYFDETATDDYFVEITFGQFNTGGVAKADTKAAFAQATYDVTDDLSLTAGLRYTDETKEFLPIQFALTTYVFPVGPSELNAAGDMFVHPVTGELFPLIPTGTAAIVPAGTIFFEQVNHKKSVSDATPMASINYRWSDDVMTYFTYSEGFKSGGFNARNVKPNPGGLPEFEPETARTYELGAKTDLFDGKLRLNGAAFRTSYNNLQFIVREDFAPITFNAGKARIQGFELEYTWIPTPDLQVTGGVGYIDAKYQELGVKVITNGGVDESNALPHTPEWSLNMGAAYNFYLGELGTLTPRLDWSYHSKMFFNAENTEAIAQDGYHLLNAAFIYDSPDSNWQVVFAIENLTDKLYRLSGNSSLRASASYAESTYARPRQWSVKTKFTF
ncbi:MAG: TonB-dependent receptor [Sphingomonadales bacterium]